MPLTMLKAGEEKSIKKVGGREETRQFLARLGFIPGSYITVVCIFRSERSSSPVNEIQQSGKIDPHLRDEIHPGER